MKASRFNTDELDKRCLAATGPQPPAAAFRVATTATTRSLAIPVGPHSLVTAEFGQAIAAEYGLALAILAAAVGKDGREVVPLEIALGPPRSLGFAALEPPRAEQNHDALCLRSLRSILSLH